MISDIPNSSAFDERQDTVNYTPEPINSAQRPEVMKLTADIMGLAHRVAERYWGNSFTREDLTQEAALGFVAAAHTFDPERGTSFITYGVRSARGYVLHAIRDKSTIIRQPRSVSVRDPRIENAMNQIEQTGVVVTDEAIAEIAGVTTEDVHKYKDGRRRIVTVSTEVPQGAEEDRVPIQIPDISSVDSFQHIEDAMVVGDLLTKLDERSRRIIEARFGLGEFNERHSQVEIANIEGISQMHVSRLIRRALAHLREELSEEI